MQKTKVLFVLLQLDAGGSERVVFDLARGLDPNKFEIFVAAFKGGVLVSPLKKICTDVFIIKKCQGFDIAAMFTLAKIVKINCIDVVNAHHYMPCFYSFLGTKVLNSKRLIYTEHSVPEVENVLNCFHRKTLQWMLLRINAVVGVSSAITNKFREKYPRHAVKFHEILNGVDIEKFKVKGSREKVRSSWGLSEDHFVVGTVANFRNVKNHACLLRAAGRLKDSHPNLRLFFVGTAFPDDPENSENKVRTLISELGIKEKVILAGYQENVPELLSTFDAFCLPSFSEGLPVSLLEAMAAGVPVICSEVAGTKEVVTHKKTGLLFPVDDDKQLALLIAEVMAGYEYSQVLATNGFNYIIEQHSSKSWQQNYEKVLLG